MSTLKIMTHDFADEEEEEKKVNVMTDLNLGLSERTARLQPNMILGGNSGGKGGFSFSSIFT